MLILVVLIFLVHFLLMGRRRVVVKSVKGRGDQSTVDDAGKVE